MKEKNGVTMKEEIVCFFCKDDLVSQNVWKQINKDFTITESNTVFDGKKVSRYENENTIYWLAHTENFIYKNGKYYAELTEKIFSNATKSIIVGFHSGKSGAILTVHSIGEPSKTDGPYTPGQEFAYTSAKLLKNTVINFDKYMSEFELQGFEVTMEVTHGSPVDFKIPIIDFEIGSTDIEYNNEIAGKVLAHSLFHINDEIDFIPAIGIGGLHYASKFARVNIMGKYGVGHIFPSIKLNDLNVEIVRKAVDLTIEEVKAIIIDKKERGIYKQLSRSIGEELGLEVITHGLAMQK